MRKNLHIIHVLNQYAVTASAIDQIQYTLNDDIHRVSLIVGPSPVDRISKEAVTAFNIKVLKNNIFSIRGFFELKDLLQKLEPDILHLHHAKSGFISSVLSRILGIKSVIEDGAKRDNYKILTRVLFTLAEIISNRVVFVSHSVKDSLSFVERWLIQKEKSSVINYGIQVPTISNKSKQKIIDKLCLNTNEVIISHTGRLIPVKNQDEIIRLFAKIKTEGMKLVIAGEGPLRSELEALVKELKLENQVVFTGMLERSEVYELLSISTYFIMLSKTEGHSVSLLEAMAYGCVPILSKIDSFIETVSEDCSVFVDYESKYENVQQSMSKIDAVSVKQHYNSNYSSSKMMSKYYEIYEQE